jgi:MoxR-like ATPase
VNSTIDNFRLVDRPATGHDPAQARDRLAARVLPPALRDFRASATLFEPSEELLTAINMALSVGAPLLLTGEPGTGKTQVAWFLGWYFEIPTFDFQVKSTSIAEDLRWDFDAVGYLHFAQTGDTSLGRSREDFLKQRALWRAYECKTDSVVLIDEIDKAPRDFPNDLLHELDKHEFHHPFDENRAIAPRSGRPPIVVVTSNDERRLPDAFLRRCIYHRIELTEELVSRAVAARAGDFPRLSEATREVALRRFWELRERDDLEKKPSTAEVLVWLTILSARDIGADGIADPVPLGDLPAVEALVKDANDLALLR